MDPAELPDAILAQAAPAIDQVVAPAVQLLLSQGLLGTIVAFLLWYALRQERKLDELREAHKIEIAAERRLNADLQETRLHEAKTVLEVISSNRSTIESLLAAARKESK